MWIRIVIVYVAHDDIIGTRPSWLSSFSDTGDNIVTTDTALSIFESNFLAPCRYGYAWWQ
jgi:hypothetical protein